jgi:hypothetical protein
MHAENYGAIWKHEWIHFASSLTQDGSSLLNIQTNVSSANHRKELFSNVLNHNAAILSAEDTFVWILSNEDPSCVRELAKLIH